MNETNKPNLFIEAKTSWIKKLKMLVFNICMKYLFNLITSEGVITIKHFEPTKTKSKVLVSGVELSESQRAELISDAKAILRLTGFHRIQLAMRAEATERLINRSTTIDDMVAGKVMLYSIDVERRLIEQLAALSQ